MDLREAILKEHSQKQTRLIASYIGSDQKKFDQLMNLFFNDEYRVVQRSAWVLSYCGEAYPRLLKKHLKKLIYNLNRPLLHDAVKRNTLRIMQFIEVPDDLSGLLVDQCFRFIRSATEPIAVKAISINIISHLTKKYPDLKIELIPLIEELNQDKSPAIKSSVKHALKELEIKPARK